MESVVLEDLLEHLHNRFEVRAIAGRFAISGGSMELPEDFLKEGQYYWIDGSTFNDGLHRHPDPSMSDEEFHGSVTALAIPPALLELSCEIDRWVEANASVLDSAYQSESFGGYSYTKGGVSGGLDGWKAHFRTRLNRWRKLG